jgi:hypothetical protein
MSKTPFVPVGFVQVFPQIPLGPVDSTDNHLANSVAPADGEWLLSQVDQRHLDFPPIIAIYGSGCIDHCQTVLYSQSTPRSHLPLEVGTKAAS